MAGRRILVTRAAQQAGKLSDGLRDLGAIPVEVPVLKSRLPLRSRPWTGLWARSADTTGSSSPARIRLPRLKARGEAIGHASGAPVHSKGSGGGDGDGRGRAGSGLECDVDLRNPTWPKAWLLPFSERGRRGKRILLARAEVARDVIPDALRGAGAMVDVVDAYRNVIPESAPGQLRRALAEAWMRATFTSSSSVTHLADVARTANVGFPFPGVPAVSIGRVTSETLRAAGWEPAAEADPHDIPGLIAAVENLLDRH